MANEQNTNGKILPVDRKAFYRGYPIKAGNTSGSANDPGIATLARNANTLYGSLRVPLIADHRGSTPISVFYTDYTLVAYYVVPVPRLSRRTTIRVTVDSSATNLWAIKFTTSAGDTEYTGLGTSRSNREFDVPVAPVDELILVYVKTHYASNTVYVYNIHAHLKEWPDTNLDSAGYSIDPGYFYPIATEETQDQEPLSVDLVRRLQSTSKLMFVSSLRTITTWSKPYEDALETPNDKALLHQWLYWPRIGVDTLVAYIDGYSDGGGSPTYTIGINNTEPVSFTVGTAGVSNKAAFSLPGGELTVPRVAGPLRISLWGEGDQTDFTHGYLNSISIFERMSNAIYP